MVYSIYMHTSPSGKRYIGITKQKPEQRWGKGRNYKGNTYFSGAIEKYGWDNFKHEILFEVDSLEKAKELEIQVIAQYRSDERDYGYNITKGGDPCNLGLGEEGRKANRRKYEHDYYSDPNNRNRRRAWEREHSKSQEFKDKRNAYNKTDARRQHRTEYMRKYRETHKEKMAEISHRAYLKRTGQLEEGEKMHILVDTREQKYNHVTDYFDKEGIKWVRSKLICGDYQNPLNPTVIIDRKKDLQEVAANVCQQHQRFVRELELARELGYKMIVLIEENDIKSLADVVTWYNWRRKKNPRAISGKQLYKIMSTMSQKYGVEWEFTTKANCGKRITELLGG